MLIHVFNVLCHLYNFIMKLVKLFLLLIIDSIFLIGISFYDFRLIKKSFKKFNLFCCCEKENYLKYLFDLKIKHNEK